MKLVMKLNLYENTDPYGGVKGKSVSELIEIDAPPQAFRAMVSAVAREFVETIDAMTETMNSKTNKEIE